MLVASHPSSSSSGLQSLAKGRTIKISRLTKTPPNISIIPIELENILEILNSFVELLLCPEDTAYGIHSRNGSWIGT